MITKNILPGEVYQLAECLEALAEYHNRVSAHHSGFYPGRPIEDTLELFRETLCNQTESLDFVRSIYTEKKESLIT